MPEFEYVARDASGQRVSGTLEAVTQQEVLKTLALRSLFPVEIGAKKAAEPIVFRRRVPRQLLAVTLGQLADLLQSGVPLLRSLEILKRQVAHSGMKRIFEDLHHQVEDGATLADAMARHQRAFGPMAVSMVHAGSEGGFLEESLARVSSFIEMQEDLKGRTVGAIAYPAVLALFGTTIVVVLLVFVVPRFEPIFEALRQRGELPWATKWLLATSGLLSRWFIWVAIVVVAAVVGAWRWLVTERGRRWRDLTKMRLPMAGIIFRNLAIARFCRVLGTMLGQGVPILNALRISSESAGNRVLAEAILAATENISAGETLARPLGKCKHFPEAVVEMIAVAEESNRLKDVLVTIADALERRTFRRLDLAVRLLEPVMLVVMACVVLFLVMALMLPMFKMGLAIQ